MWYDDDDFYNEPSEFEMQMNELKESLLKSVKSEFLEEMEKLRKENKNLQGIKEHFEQIKRDYEKKKAECDRTICEAELKAKRMKANELMEHFRIFTWGITSECLYGPKCDKCDEARRIEITLPSGKIVKDNCECSRSRTTVMVPQRMVLYEIADRDQEITAWYSACGNENNRYYIFEYASSVCSKKMIEPGTSFDEVKKIEKQRTVLFTTEEECRAYCEYLNETNGVTSDVIYRLDGEVYKMNVTGIVVKQYFPTACEEQTMIQCDDGRLYHAPTRMFMRIEEGYR